MSERIGLWRLWVTGGIMALLAAGLLTRLYGLHVMPDADGLQRIERLRSFESNLHGGRGNIRESSAMENTLALNINLKDICADPQRLQQIGAVTSTAGILAQALSLDAQTLVDQFSRPGRRFVYVQRFVSETEADRIAQRRLPGVFFEDAEVRHYPLGSFLCHVIGFTNLEGVGSAGVEQRYHSRLTGTAGFRTGRLDGSRREIPNQRTQEVAPQAGADVVLTIDQTVQHLVEQALDEAMDTYQAQAAWAIVQRVRTGEIMAMASRPAYDLNEFREATDDQRLNRAVGVVFEPGSVMKPMVIAGALNDGLITPATMVDCENGNWLYNRRPLRDYRPHGRLSVAEIVQKSSNIGTAKIALEMGDAQVEKYLRDFGFGDPTGIDLPGEEAGILHPHRRWSSICATRIAIGQSVATTAIQMLSAINAIANDGFLMRPYVVREVREAGSGAVLYQAEPQVLRRPVNAQSAAMVRTMMRMVTLPGGTGRNAHLDSVAVAGKTGTAQKPLDGGYSKTDYVATFVGFFPADNPEVGIIVVVDTPRPQYTGGAVAAPVFRRIAESLVRYLDIGPGIPQLADRASGGRL